MALGGAAARQPWLVRNGHEGHKTRLGTNGERVAMGQPTPACSAAGPVALSGGMHRECCCGDNTGPSAIARPPTRLLWIAIDLALKRAGTQEDLDILHP